MIKISKQQSTSDIVFASNINTTWLVYRACCIEPDRTSRNIKGNLQFTVQFGQNESQAALITCWAMDAFLMQNDPKLSFPVKQKGPEGKAKDQEWNFDLPFWRRHVKVLPFIEIEP